MIALVRCMGCGKPIGHLFEEYTKRTASGEGAKKVLDELRVERYCCRAAFLGHVDILKEIAKFKKS